MRASRILKILIISVALLIFPSIQYTSCPISFGGFLQLSMAIDDPGCTNEDCPPDPGCTNEDCPPDPGCTNEDCPPDPGCTNEDCPLPDYYGECCCYEDYDPNTNGIQRLCCCKDGRKVNCRLSKVISYDPPDHETIADISLVMGQIPKGSKGLCAPDWFIYTFRNPWWPIGKGCGWWKQLHKCGPFSGE